MVIKIHADEYEDDWLDAEAMGMDDLPESSSRGNPERDGVRMGPNGKRINDIDD